MTILDLPGMKETAEVVILSIPEDHPQHLNLLYLFGVALLVVIIAGFLPKTIAVGTVRVICGPLTVSVLEEGKT
ncbi:MAG: hypothetical protein MRJ65_13900 [Candidatus Brocadiaceae bacterium]|nr:hypothetical protein [Candidatus Brocadiaceae bacterium]